MGDSDQGKGLTEVDSEGDSGREDKRADEFDGDDKLHAEAESAAKVADEDELHEIVNGTIDPSAALGE